MNEIVLKVNGMMCVGCENRIKNAIQNIHGVKEVTADHTIGKVIVSFDKDISQEIIKETLEDIGYEIIEK